jgi:hypothetical protein
MTTILHGIAGMLTEHWFWGATTLICLLWYSTVTIYVAIKGAGDIRSMLRRLAASPRVEGPSGSQRQEPR